MELRRRRFGRAVRLEVAAGASEAVREMLTTELEVSPDGVYQLEAPIGLSGLWAVYALDRPDLHEETWTPMTPPYLATAGNAPTELFAVLRERDVLVHHPYDSFATSVEAFISQAATTPTCSGSSRPSTARRVTARSWPHSSGRRNRASRSLPSSS